MPQKRIADYHGLGYKTDENLLVLAELFNLTIVEHLSPYVVFVRDSKGNTGIIGFLPEYNLFAAENFIGDIPMRFLGHGSWIYKIKI